MSIVGWLAYMVVFVVLGGISSYVGQHLAQRRMTRQLARLHVMHAQEAALSGAALQELAVLGHTGLVEVMNLLMRYSVIPADDLRAVAQRLAREGAVAQARFEAVQQAVAAGQKV